MCGVGVLCWCLGAAPPADFVGVEGSKIGENEIWCRIRGLVLTVELP